MLLLDTHALLWWLDDPVRLAPTAESSIRDATVVFVSAATAWEIAIKRASGKLSFSGDLELLMAENDFDPLPITVRHALAVESLPPFHRDPFDRLLIAQAQCEGLRLVSRDPDIAKYPIRVIAA